MSRYFLGIDVSTTGAKALLIDEKGTVAASATTALTLQTPKPLWSEQDPHEWWKGTAASIRKALAEAGAKGEDVAAVGLTGQMHGLVLLDARAPGPPPRHPVERPADRRRVRRDREARREEASSSARSGNVALTGFTAPKILWVRNHEPEVYAKAKLVLLPKDYVRLRLTGEAAMDKADGSGTILFDLKARTWSKRVLEKLDIPADWLPPTFEGPETTGTRHRRGRGRDGTEGRHPGDGRRRRPGGGRRGRGRRPARRRLADPRHLRRRLRDDRRPARRARGAPPRLLPRRARPLALHGRDALGRGQPAVVPRHPHAEGELRRHRGRGRAGAGRQRGAAVPALPLRRADPLPRPARARQLRGPHPPPQAGAPDPRRARGRRLLDEGLLQPAAGRGARGGEGGPDRRRRREGPAVAEDRGERPRPADGDRQQHGGRGLRGGAPRRRRRRRLADGRGRVRRDDRRHRPRRAGHRVGRRPTRPSTRATASCTPR